MNPHRHLRPANSQVQHIVVTLKPVLGLQSTNEGKQILVTTLARVLESNSGATVDAWIVEALNESSIDTFAIAPASDCVIEVDDAWQITNLLHRQPEVLYATLLLRR